MILMVSVNSFFVFMYITYCALIIATLTQEINPVTRLGQLFLFQYTFFTAGETKSRLFVGNESNFLWNPSSSAYKNYDGEQALSIQRIFTHRHAHVDTPDLFYSELYSEIEFIPSHSENDVCDVLSVLPYKGGNLLAGMYARKGFPFRNEFNHALSRIREAGINYRVLRNYDALTITRCLEETVHYQEDLGMSYVGSAFVGLGITYLGVGIILLFEFYLQRRVNLRTKFTAIYNAPSDS
ncbi:unnamed protein product [Orchesella dallaii]|uniref:Ionotropic glutamate receptor C-terminal domain-containing protein n=1 Tax=Orchesella dallaii TaxID=48710 RepID=A0ABP1PPK5_9HEXA